MDISSKSKAVLNMIPWKCVDDCCCRGGRWQETVQHVKQFYIGLRMSMFSPEKQFEHSIYPLTIVRIVKTSIFVGPLGRTLCRFVYKHEIWYRCRQITVVATLVKSKMAATYIRFCYNCMTIYRMIINESTFCRFLTSRIPNLNYILTKNMLLSQQSCQLPNFGNIQDSHYDYLSYDHK